MPVAASCWVWPAIRDSAPVTAIDFNEGDTVTVAVPATPDSVAEMVLCPALIPVTDPLDETETIVAAEEVQAAAEVTSLVDPSLYVAVADNCWLWPTTTDIVPVTAIDLTVGALVPVVLPGELLPHPSKPSKGIASTDTKSKPNAKRANPNFLSRFNLHLSVVSIELGIACENQYFTCFCTDASPIWQIFVAGLLTASPTESRNDVSLRVSLQI